MLRVPSLASENVSSWALLLGELHSGLLWLFKSSHLWLWSSSCFLAPYSLRAQCPFHHLWTPVFLLLPLSLKVHPSRSPRMVSLNNFFKKMPVSSDLLKYWFPFEIPDIFPLGCTVDLDPYINSVFCWGPWKLRDGLRWATLIGRRHRPASGASRWELASLTLRFCFLSSLKVAVELKAARINWEGKKGGRVRISPGQFWTERGRWHGCPGDALLAARVQHVRAGLHWKLLEAPELFLWPDSGFGNNQVTLLIFSFFPPFPQPGSSEGRKEKECFAANALDGILVLALLRFCPPALVFFVFIVFLFFAELNLFLLCLSLLFVFTLWLILYCLFPK